MTEILCKISFRDFQNWQDIDGNIFFWKEYTEKVYVETRPIFNGWVTEKEITDSRGGIERKLQNIFGKEYYIELLVRENHFLGLQRILYSKFVRFEYSNGIAHEPYEQVRIEAETPVENNQVRRVKIYYKVGLTVSTPALDSPSEGTTIQFYNLTTPIKEVQEVSAISGNLENITAFGGTYSRKYNTTSQYVNNGGFIQFEFDVDYYWRELQEGDRITASFIDIPVSGTAEVTELTQSKITLLTNLDYSTYSAQLISYPNLTFSWSGDAMKVTYITSNKPIVIQADYESNTSNETGTIIPNRQVNKLKKQVRFWVIGKDAETISKLINLCDTVTITDIDGNVDTSQETFTPKVSEVDGEDLYEVTLEYVTSIIVYHRFRT